MDRRQRVADLRVFLSGCMADHEERSIDIWQAALVGLLGRLSEWALEDPDDDEMTSDMAELANPREAP
jgi:hypothetical protein